MKISELQETLNAFHPDDDVKALRLRGIFVFVEDLFNTETAQTQPVKINTTVGFAHKVWCICGLLGN